MNTWDFLNGRRQRGHPERGLRAYQINALKHEDLVLVWFNQERRRHDNRSTPQHQLVHSYDQWSPAKENVLNIFVSS